ncbi:NUDIX domain-containing protein [Streptomyces sp. NBC_00006]|uniref:NUDIX hydrolase n=1 Tax=unclassified Streptomyces TaxID=2593676 RepID=UPI00225B0D92|nr:MULTISPECIES: NUDIX domain-containing protein [unclassified Streptomyces]MCX4832909.1 NUDIX domain-containing protein [Streptomyces sp. NBC_01016]MCX5533887.1 NUDIX domain-containing protein [Streptomyces sp. NBC_00006]
MQQGTVMDVVAAAVVRDGRLLVVSKQAAPDVFYLPGGKPDPGECPEETLARELDEELGVVPGDVERLAVVEDVAALEGVPMRMVVFGATLSGEPSPAAELAAMRWTDGLGDVRLAPAVGGQVVPLLRELGWL